MEGTEKSIILWVSPLQLLDATQNNSTE